MSSEPIKSDASPDYLFGVSEFTTWPWSFSQDIDHYSRLSVQAIEVCEFKLQPSGIAEQLSLVQERGMIISSAQPSVRTLFPSQSQPEPKQVADRVARFSQTIESFVRHAQGLAFVTNTGIAPNGDIQALLDTAATEYRKLADQAAEHGAKIAFEPLNPTIMNIESAIWTLQQARDLVESVDRPNFGICLDFWNIWQNPDVEDAIRTCGDWTFVVQVSDWRTPRSTQDRLIPGQGSIPLPRLLRAVRQSGFAGAISVEIFSGHVTDSLWDRNLDDVILQSREGLDRAWRESLEVEDAAAEFDA